MYLHSDSVSVISYTILKFSKEELVSSFLLTISTALIEKNIVSVSCAKKHNSFCDLSVKRESEDLINPF